VLKFLRRSQPTRSTAASRRAPREAAPRTAAQQRYADLVEHMLSTHQLTVRRWRSTTSGVAILQRLPSGNLRRVIEAPYPRGPVSAAIFLHEVGHHAIGLGAVRPRCLEEYRAWSWALDAMREHDIAVTQRVQDRMDRAMRYAVAKAVRRGLKRLPAELLPYLPETT
jgi:hypothetical protein